ncbi:hypothetical protein EON73_04450 [bacterium]|nr:MAG: hypothetical protein EON73_04450 [bacterium]
MKIILIILNLLLASGAYCQNTVWLIGTAHEKNNYINADSLTNIFNKIKPDLLLLELEEKHFTKDFKYDTTKYPLKDYLTSNENIAAYNYQQQTNVQLRPFDIKGRHEFYEKVDYRNKENKMFGEIFNLYKNNRLSGNTKVDFEILLASLNNYSNLRFTSLREANSDVATKFMALKSKVDFELMVSIIEQNQELKKWLTFAKLRKNYWAERNNVMAENIVRYCNEFKNKKIIIMVGNDHKYILLELLKQNNILVKNYYDE